MYRATIILFVCLRLASSQSCVGRCNDSADSSYTCQCNALCDTYSDCCADYIATCVPDGSCSGRCTENFDPDNTCHCTPECEQYNNCCVDYVDQCQNVVGTCSGRCGTSPDNSQSCQCNDVCATYGDCCPDYQSVCGASGGSCAGRCDTSADSSQPCQCNSVCESYGDCCSDYQSVCDGSTGGGETCPSRYVTSAAISDVSLVLYDLDTNRALSDEFEINLQTQTSSSSSTDKSSERFFTSVSQNLLANPSYVALINLLDNYERNQGINEDESSTEIAEQDEFLDLFMSSAVGTALYNFFIENGALGCPTPDGFKEQMRKMWFEFYSRQNGAMDTSGFEHVFVGEIKSGDVSGFHNWVQFYLQEKIGSLNYHGWISKTNANVVGTQFSWDGSVKPIGGGAVGVSPEYELAVLTLCHVLKSGSACNIQMRDSAGNPTQESIQTYSWSKTSPGGGLKYVSTAYFLS